ncbi:MAG: AAA family ATPase [Campylobacterota bacterium]|nr:AAA family ATPase [Campylobacterota bacterium]
MLIEPGIGKDGGMKYLEDGKIAERVDENGEVITREQLDHRITIAGDAEITKEIIEHTNKTQNWNTSYYHFSFSFKEEDMTVEDMASIQKEAEDFYLAGFNKDEYNIYSEIHKPKEDAKYKLFLKNKDGKEYFKLMSEKEADMYKKKWAGDEKKLEQLKARKPHFHLKIAKLNLLTNTQLKINEKTEKDEWDNFQEYINIKYGLQSPKENKKDISKKQYLKNKLDFKDGKETKIPKWNELKKEELPKLTNIMSKKVLEEHIRNKLENGEIKNHLDVINELKNLKNIEKVEYKKRKSGDVIVVNIKGQVNPRDPSKTKNTNLTAEYFTQNFYKDKQIDFNKDLRAINGVSMRDREKQINAYKERRILEVNKRYDYARSKALKTDLIEKALNEKFGEKKVETTNKDKIIADLEKNKSVFLTGGAGVGKSYVTHQVIEHFENQGKTVARTGSTGIAATNIGGETLHSYFEIGVHKDLEALKKADEFKKPEIAEKRNVKLRDNDLIVIDEISMVSDKQMEMIKYRLEQADYKGQIMAVGDFQQLPPVAKDTKVGYAFESKAWKNLETKTHELTVIKRSDNKDFSELLNRLRYGKINEKDNLFISNMQNNKVNEDKATYIFSTNKAVDEHNKEKLNKLDGIREVYKTSIQSDNPNLTNNDKTQLLNETPIYNTLEIKETAPVILTTNDRDLGVANGDKGVYLGRDKDDNMLVKLERNEKVVAIGRKTFNAELEKKDGKKINAKFTNYPIRPAYAITTHKSQGMSIDHLAIDPNKQFEKNQFYVALSRAKDPQTTKILPLDAKYKGDFQKVVKQDNKVLDFYHPTLRTKELKDFDRQVQERQEKRTDEFFKNKKSNIKEIPKEDAEIKPKTNIKEIPSKKSEIENKNKVEVKSALEKIPYTDSKTKERLSFKAIINKFKEFKEKIMDMQRLKKLQEDAKKQELEKNTNSLEVKKDEQNTRIDESQKVEKDRVDTKIQDDEQSKKDALKDEQQIKKDKEDKARLDKTRLEKAKEVQNKQQKTTLEKSHEQKAKTTNIGGENLSTLNAKTGNQTIDDRNQSILERAKKAQALEKRGIEANARDAEALRVVKEQKDAQEKIESQKVEQEKAKDTKEEKTEEKVEEKSAMEKAKEAQDTHKKEQETKQKQEQNNKATLEKAKEAQQQNQNEQEKKQKR